MVSVVVIGRIGVCRIALGMSGEYAHEALVTGQFEIGVNMLCGEIETQEVVFVERPGLIGDCRREGDKSYGHDAVGYVGIESEVEAFFALDIFLLEKCRGPCVAGKPLRVTWAKLSNVPGRLFIEALYTRYSPCCTALTRIVSRRVLSIDNVLSRALNRSSESFDTEADSCPMSMPDEARYCAATLERPMSACRANLGMALLSTGDIDTHAVHLRLYGGHGGRHTRDE